MICHRALKIMRYNMNFDNESLFLWKILSLFICSLYSCTSQWSNSSGTYVLQFMNIVHKYSWAFMNLIHECSWIIFVHFSSGTFMYQKWPFVVHQYSWTFMNFLMNFEGCSWILFMNYSWTIHVYSWIVHHHFTWVTWFGSWI